MLATWDLDLDFGIMITHKILAMKLQKLQIKLHDGDGLFVILSLSFHNNVVTKIALNLLKLNNNQGFSEPLSKLFYFMKAQSIPFPANFEQ